MNDKVFRRISSSKVLFAVLVLVILAATAAVPAANAQVMTDQLWGYNITLKITGVYCQDNEEGFSGSDEIYLDSSLWGGGKVQSLRSFTYDMDRGESLHAGHFNTITLYYVPYYSGMGMQIELKEDDSGFWDGDDLLGTAPGTLTPAELEHLARTGQYIISSHWLTGSNNGDSFAYRVDFEVHVEPIYNIARIG